MASGNVTVPMEPVPALSSFSINLNGSLGAAFIGLIFAAILFGVTNIQSLIYYQSSSRDPKYMKWTIAFLWILDALHLALISHVLYFYMVTNFTNLLIITKPTWSLCLHVIVTTLSDFIVRLYYARRVWIMSRRNWLLTIGSIAITTVTFVSGLGFGIKMQALSLNSEVQRLNFVLVPSFSFTSLLQFSKISWLLYTSLGSAVVADLWVAISLCFFLGRNKTGFKATDSKVNALIIYIINTGLLTSLCAICSFVSYAAMPDNYVFIGFYFSLSKLYFNSLLATLNAREHLREGLSGSSSGAGAYRMPRIVSVSSPAGLGSKHATSFGTVGTPTRTEFNFGDKENQALAVSVRKETNYHTDDGELLPDRYTSVLPI